MSESIEIDNNESKEMKYRSLLPQIEALVSGEKNLIANLANISAALHQTFNFWWVGFYLMEDDTLVLGPFQGPVACTRISLGKGVCGLAFAEKRTVLVPDVEAFPGHIACSAASKSEIVVPVLKDGQVKMVLDIDSDQLDSFDQDDQKYLEQLAHLISSLS